MDWLGHRVGGPEVVLINVLVGVGMGDGTRNGVDFEWEGVKGWWGFGGFPTASQSFFLETISPLNFRHTGVVMALVPSIHNGTGHIVVVD